MTQPLLEATIVVSQPYHVVGFQGSRYGASNWTRRDYWTEFNGHQITKSSKREIQDRVRDLAYQATGSRRVKFSFVDQEV